jgi:Putative Ig domain/Bacterial Ig-like domain (group 3)
MTMGFGLQGKDLRGRRVFAVVLLAMLLGVANQVWAQSSAPVVTASGTVNFNLSTLNPVVLDPGITISDSSATTLASGTVSIGAGFESGDILEFTNTSATLFGNITGSYNPGTGVLTLTSSGATATLAQWQVALRSIVFSTSATVSGARTISFVVNDGALNSAAATKVVNVSAPTISVTPTTLPNATAGVAYSQTVGASGGTAPYAYSISAGTLPPGFSINAATGTISGTATTTGNYSFTLSATDHIDFIGTQSYTLVVGAPTITLSPTTLLAATIGVGYSATFTASGGAAPYTYSLLAGALPTGVTLTTTGVLSGAAAATGTSNFTFTVKATDANGFTTNQAYSLTVNPPPTVAALSNPLGVASDGAGNLYISDAGLGYIVKVPVGCAAQSCETQLGSGLENPAGVAVDGGGNVYVVESVVGNGSVVVIPWDGTNGSYDAAATIATGLTTNTLLPGGVAVDGGGSVYYTDTANQEVVKLPWTGSGYGAATVVLGSSSEISPTGVAVDGNGNLYIASGVSHTLTELAASGTQTTLATNVTADSVAVDGSGDVYYSDSNAGSVTKLPWTGLAFGSPVVLMSTGLEAPAGLAVDGAGDVYVVNNTAKTVVKIAVSAPPTLSFASTKVGATSTDSPQAVTLTNIGNTGLTFGSSPSLSAGFAFDTGTDCLTGAGAQPLGEGSSCTFAIDFTPTDVTIGALNGQLLVTDNNLNTSYTTHSVTVSGTGVPDDVSAVAVSVHSASPVFGQAVSVTATVTDTTNPGTAATGNVTFTDTDSLGNVTSLGGAAALTGAVASTTYTPSTAGAHTIMATYSGLVGNIAQGTGKTTLIVGKVTPTLSYTPSVPSQVYGAAIAASALNATAMASNGAVAGSFVYTATVNGAQTTLTAGATILPVGSYTITATFTPANGTDYVSGATVTANYTVTSAALVVPTLSFATIAPQTFGTPPFAVSATSASSGAVAYAVVSGPATIAGKLVTLTGVGTVLLSASQAPAGNYAAATATTSVTVLAPTFALTSNSSPTGGGTVLPGGSAIFSLMLVPAGTSDPDALSLSANGLPAGATASFSPAMIPAGSPATAITLTIQTRGNSQTAHMDRIGLGRPPLALSCLLLPVIGIRRARARLRRMPGLLGVLLATALSLAAAMGLCGCGGGDGFFNQASQSYTVTVTATDGTTHVQASTNVILTVR